MRVNHEDQTVARICEWLEQRGAEGQAFAARIRRGDWREPQLAPPGRAVDRANAAQREAQLTRAAELAYGKAVPAIPARRPGGL
jgi:hypothetical protein